MANTLGFSGYAPNTADGSEAASCLPNFTGGATAPLNTYAQMRFATSFAPSGAGTVADLFMVGGAQNPKQWTMTNYTATGTVLSAPVTCSLCDYNDAFGGSSGEIMASILPSASGGLQGTYGGQPYIRFATAFAPANGLTVMDLVMTGGRNDTERWSVVVYTVTGGVLS